MDYSYAPIKPKRIAYESAEGALLTLRVRLLKRWCFKGPTWGWPFTGSGALGRREAGREGGPRGL